MVYYVSVRILSWNLWGRFGPWQERATATLTAAKKHNGETALAEFVGWFGGDVPDDFLSENG